MTARDNYPILRSHYDEQWRAMVDEIDRLRAENRELRKLADLNALRRTLTNPTLRRITRAAPE